MPVRPRRRLFIGLPSGQAHCVTAGLILEAFPDPVKPRSSRARARLAGGMRNARPRGGPAPPLVAASPGLMRSWAHEPRSV